MTCTTYQSTGLNIFPYTYMGNYKISLLYGRIKPIPVAVRSKKWVCCRSLAGIAGSNPAGTVYMSVSWSVVCCQEEASASGRSLVQRSRTECNHEVSIMKSLWPPMDCFAMEKESGRNNLNNFNIKHERAFPIRAYINIAKTVTK